MLRQLIWEEWQEELLQKKSEQKEHRPAERVKGETTWCESKRESHCLGISDGQQVFIGSEDRQLLEALTGSPDREVVPSIIGLQRTREWGAIIKVSQSQVIQVKYQVKLESNQFNMIENKDFTYNLSV